MCTHRATPDASSQVAQLAERARSGLAATRFRHLTWVSTTGSTNSDVLARAREGDPEGTVIVADQQTAGRGRRGRSWEAPPGASLLVTILLRPPAALAPGVTMAVGVAAAEAVQDVAGVTVGLKWPNDLVVKGPEGDERKLAGILAETDWPTGATIAGGWREPAPHERVTVVAGMGLNVNWPAPESTEMPAEVLDRAVALNWLAGEGEDSAAAGAPAEVDRVALLVSFLSGLERHYRDLVGAGQLDGMQEVWRSWAATLGRRVRVDLGADDVEGVAVDISAEGHLVVETLEGERRTLAVGDVVHLRDA